MFPPRAPFSFLCGTSKFPHPLKLIGREPPMRVTLGEGSTPLLPLPRLSARLGVELWVKWEGANPTGSFKDRGMAVAVSRALERGAPGIVCASTGNTAASAASYAARAGLPAIVVTSRGGVARGKMIQALAVGVQAREIDGSFDDAHLEARRLAEAEGLVNVNSINPDRIEGQSSAARESARTARRPPRRARAALRRRR